MTATDIAFRYNSAVIRHWQLKQWAQDDPENEGLARELAQASNELEQARKRLKEVTQ